MTTENIAIPTSQLRVHEDGTIPLTPDAQTACTAAVRGLSNLGIEATAYQVAAASMISAKMPQKEEYFLGALDWVVTHASTMQGEPIPCAEITTMCQTAHLPDGVDRLGRAKETMALDNDGNVIFRSPLWRARLERLAKEWTVEQGRPVTLYHLAVSVLIGKKDPSNDPRQILDWVIARQDLENGSPIPRQEVEKAARAKQLPMLPPQRTKENPTMPPVYAVE
jgi:hypothetical protein